MNWIDGNHLISLFNNVNISLSLSGLFASCRKGTFIIQKMRNRLFVRALHMVIVIIVWCRFISNVVIVAKKCRSQKQKGRKRGRMRDGQLIAFQCIYSIFLWYHFWTVKKEFYLYETDCFIYKFLCSFFSVQ